MQALTRKSITLMCLASAVICGVLMLTACGRDSEPTEQKPPVEAPAAPVAVEAPAAPEAAAPAAEAAAEPAAEPAPEEKPASYTATCYSGSSQVLIVNDLSADNWDYSNGLFTFSGFAGGKKEFYNGVCVVTQD